MSLVLLDLSNISLPLLEVLVNSIVDICCEHIEAVLLHETEHGQKLLSFKIHFSFLGVLILVGVGQVVLIHLRDYSNQEVHEHNEHEVLLAHPDQPNEVKHE